MCIALSVVLLMNKSTEQGTKETRHTVHCRCDFDQWNSLWEQTTEGEVCVYHSAVTVKYQIVIVNY